VITIQNKAYKIGKLAFEDLDKKFELHLALTKNVSWQCKVNMGSKLTWICVWMEVTSAR
jgi:hypothetical protein